MMKRILMTWLTVFLVICSPALFSEAQSRRPQPGPATEKLIGPVVFHWFTANSGQWISPWIPVEGRRSWDGSVEFWKGQEKLMRQAGFNIELFQVAYHNKQQQKNHLLAIRDDKNDNLPTLKVVPFFEAASFPSYDEPKTLTTEKGLNDFYQIIKEWFELYREVFYYRRVRGNVIDGSQFALVNGKVLVALWAVPIRNDRIPPSFFRYLNQRLMTDFGFEAFWSVHQWWTGGGPDEVNNLFDGSELVQRNGRAADLITGFWPLDPSYPSSTFLARNGGETYTEAWDKVIADRDSIDHIYIESWNEYTEGSGIYPAVPMGHTLGDDHWSGMWDARCWTEPCHRVPENDSWGDSPWLYIDITRQKIWELYGGSKNVDVVSPHVLITGPVQYDTVRQKIKVNILLGDNVAVAQLDVILDGVLRHRSSPGNQKNTSPVIDAGSLSEGRHVIQAIVKDAAGNSDEHQVTVNVIKH